VPRLGFVYAVVDEALSPGFPLRVEFEVCVRREDAERFIEEVRERSSSFQSESRPRSRVQFFSGRGNGIRRSSVIASGDSRDNA
jgi:hypothetical protein